MKKSVLFFTPALIMFSITSCDKVTDPIRQPVLIDTMLYPGNWENYSYPVFTQNTNTNRNLLLEDFTGHRCGNCPEAAAVAKDIELSHPGRVFVASVHTGCGGLTSLQAPASDCGEPTNPENEFCSIFYNNHGISYGEAFQSGYGFFGNPSGNVSRITFDPFMFQPASAWGGYVTQELAENDLKVNIQAASNFYPETNGLFLHVETEFLEDLTGDYSLVVYLIENHVEDYQDSLTIIVEDYDHHNVFRGCIDGLAWGRSVTGDHTTGKKTYYDYSYALPIGAINTDYHLLIYVYDVATYEILQVIKHEF